MKCLCTGGAGFIGSNLVHELVKRGFEVDIVDDMSNGHYEFLDGLNVKFVPSFMLSQYEEKYEQSRQNGQVLFIESDFEDQMVLNRIRGGMYDVVFHLAAKPSVAMSIEKPAYTYDINVTRTVSIVEAINRSPKKTRLVFSSTCAVYGDAQEIPTPETVRQNPLSPYGLQKWSVEEFLRMSHVLYGTDVVSLRYFNVYGPRQYGGSPYSTAVTAWCNNSKNDLPLRLDGDGNQTRDMVYVGDVASANIMAATSNSSFSGEVINIGSGYSVSNNEILKMFKDHFGELHIEYAPPRKGDIRHTKSDNSRAKSLLGWTPSFSFEEGLLLTWEWWGLKNLNKV